MGKHKYRSASDGAKLKLCRSLSLMNRRKITLYIPSTSINVKCIYAKKQPNHRLTELVTRIAPPFYHHSINEMQTQTALLCIIQNCWVLGSAACILSTVAEAPLKIKKKKYWIRRNNNNNNNDGCCRRRANNSGAHGGQSMMYEFEESKK